MNVSPEVVAAAIEKMRLSNPPHDIFLPTGCTRAEADRLEEEAQETRPWQIIWVNRFIQDDEIRYNDKTSEYEYRYIDDPEFT